MSSPAPDRDPAALREMLLDAAAVPGLDVAAARQRADSVARARRRTARAAIGGIAAVLLAVAAGVLLLGEDDPDELVADRTDPRTSTTTSTTSTSTAPSVTASTLPSVPTTAPLVTTTSTPTTIATTTTLAPNQPLQAELRVVTGSVEAGEVAALEVAWVDADHAGLDPDVTADWGDPAVTALSLPTPAPRCDAPGASAAGVVRREFRYATPGTHRVRVTLTTCGGEGTYAERTTVEASLVVGEAVLDGRPGRTVVAVAPRSADGLPVLPALDGASAVLAPDPPEGADVALAARTPTLFQFATSGPATVLRLPADVAGTLRLSWPDSPCTATARVELADPATAATTVALDASC